MLFEPIVPLYGLAALGALALCFLALYATTEQ